MRSLACTLATLAALAATPACSKILGIDGDVTLRDAVTPTPDSGPPPNTVIGRSYTRHTTLTGAVDVPTDLSQTLVQALILDATQASGYLVSSGTGRADGTFTIPDVPDGAPYLLKLDTSYFSTTLHEIERRFESSTRGVPAPTLLSLPTNVNFNVQGMTPVVNGPEDTYTYVDIHSVNLGYFGTVSTVPHNARSLVMPYDWARGSPAGAQPLPDAALGDDLTIVHRRDEPVSGSLGRRQRLIRIIDTFMPVGVTIANGTTTEVNGSWVPAGLNRSINISVTRGVFDVGYDEDTTLNMLNQHSMSIYLSKGDIDLLHAYLTDWSRSPSLTETLDIMYSDPSLLDGLRRVGVVYMRSRSFRLPSMTSTLFVNGVNQSIFSYSGGNLTISPVLQPPANFRVAGEDASAGGLVSFDGTAPVELSWNPVAAAKTYSIRVVRMFENGSQTRTAIAANLTTLQTSIKIPAEIFTGGEFFYFVLAAVQSPTNYHAGQLYTGGIPHYQASMPSGLFRLSSRCGNGMQDLGEECDTGGESPTCDVDCSLPVCRDGLRNAAAGEMCDAATDTGGCDLDCTVPVCGDGYRNRAVEDCDDGNTVDNGNGCSGTCRFNNVCGDGAVQLLIESCDPGSAGETATCDRDCTSAYCGDGHYNAAAGEQCDDGNSDDTDGCTSMCKSM